MLYTKLKGRRSSDVDQKNDYFQCVEYPETRRWRTVLKGRVVPQEGLEPPTRHYE
jgi:hypothetical protein